MQPRRLVLIRHAKAGDAAVDADRPLTARGERHAGAVGAWLRQADCVPDRVLVSPALRAVQTWERASAALGRDPQADVDARIYANTIEAVLEAIRETPDDVRTLAVVGHNPSIGQLAYDLDDGEGSPAVRTDVAAGFKTGGVAVFLLDTAFAEIAPGTATLIDFTVPRD